MEAVRCQLEVVLTPGFIVYRSFIRKKPVEVGYVEKRENDSLPAFQKVVFSSREHCYEEYETGEDGNGDADVVPDRKKRDGVYNRTRPRRL